MKENAERKQEKRLPWLRLLIVAVLVIAALSLLFPAVSGHQTPNRTIAQLDVQQIRVTIKRYVTEYGNPPTGDQAQIMTALRDRNPRKIIFFEASSKRFNARGEFLDPWGTPYRIDTSDPEFPWAYSFGKNRIDDGGAPSSDDISSWR